MATLKEELQKYLPLEKNGIYIELGALDGVFQSNTKWLEDDYGWTGILIEPSPNGYEKVKQNRINNKIFNCACVSFDYEGDKIKGDFNGKPMSSVNGLRRNRQANITIDAKTLQTIINETTFKNIDFLSLDVEGYEMEVLCGIDFNKQKIDFILIEVYEKDKNNIFDFMKNKNYTLIGNISNFTKETHPNWDGSHNDYLFKYVGEY